MERSKSEKRMGQRGWCRGRRAGAFLPSAKWYLGLVLDSCRHRYHRSSRPFAMRIDPFITIAKPRLWCFLQIATVVSIPCVWFLPLILILISIVALLPPFLYIFTTTRRFGWSVEYEWLARWWLLEFRLCCNVYMNINHHVWMKRKDMYRNGLQDDSYAHLERMVLLLGIRRNIYSTLLYRWLRMHRGNGASKMGTFVEDVPPFTPPEQNRTEHQSSNLSVWNLSHPSTGSWISPGNRKKYDVICFINTS